MLTGTGPLKLRAALVLMESANYELDDLLRAVVEPMNSFEFALAEAAHDDDFWVLIDAKYCEGELMTYRLDVPRSKRRSFVEGYAEQRAYIYELKQYWEIDVPFSILDEKIVIGYREDTHWEIWQNLRHKIMNSNHEEDCVGYVPLQICNLAASVGCLGFAWELSYEFGWMYYPDEHPKRVCLFNPEDDSVSMYDRVIDNLSLHIYNITCNDVDFYVPANDLGFVTRDDEIIPSRLTIPEIKSHLLKTFSEEDAISPTIFSNDGVLRTFEYTISIYNIMPDGQNVGLRIDIDICQLRF